MKAKAVVWICGNGHAFKWGNEDWHESASQYVDNEFGLVPKYCDYVHRNGEPCLDSSSLIPRDTY